MSGAGSSSGRVAIVTGGGAGIGAETVRLLAAEGAAVAVLDLRAEAAQAVAQEVKDTGSEALAVPVDVTDEAAVRAAVEQVVGTFGGIDALVNNAGMSQPTTPIVATELVDFDAMIAVNLRSTFLLTKHVAPRMGDGAAIVNVASVAALMGVEQIAAYTAAKGGVAAFTRAAAVELGPAVRVNCICPGTTLTAMPTELFRSRGGGDLDAGIAATAQKYVLGRLGTPAEIAAAAVFLAGPGSSFLTGAVIAVDGGVSAQ